MGDSGKYPYLYHGWLSEEEGGFTIIYGILRAWGVFTIGNPEAWGDFTGGISGVESVE